MSKCNGGLYVFWHKIVKLGVPRTYYIYWARNRMSLKPKLKDVVSYLIYMIHPIPPPTTEGGYLYLLPGSLGPLFFSRNGWKVSDELHGRYNGPYPKSSSKTVRRCVVQGEFKPSLDPRGLMIENSLGPSDLHKLQTRWPYVAFRRSVILVLT